LVKNPLGVEKLWDKRSVGAVSLCDIGFVSRLSSGYGSGLDRLAEEAHQALDILCCGCQEELLTHKLQLP
jgi:hypothetical protein